ncbi:MAG TPA: PilZ domain-containing protein [Terriglobales bacterium]|nr:PilZ domain-containing protein [Terriglobales bacterium]
MKRSEPSEQRSRDRRRWERIPITIPLFVRAQDEGNRQFLEFGNVLNVSAGGALLALRQYLPAPRTITLEIPAAPLAETSSLPASSRVFTARLLRVQPLERSYLWAVRFERPLLGRARAGAHGPAKAAARPRTERKAIARREIDPRAEVALVHPN